MMRAIGTPTEGPATRPYEKCDEMKLTQQQPDVAPYLRVEG
jgi:hypothetical protein